MASDMLGPYTILKIESKNVDLQDAKGNVPQNDDVVPTAPQCAQVTKMTMLYQLPPSASHLKEHWTKTSLAEQILLGKKVEYAVDPAGVNKLRLECGFQFLGGDNVPDDDGPEKEHWIACDSCGQWYHLECAGSKVGLKRGKFLLSHPDDDQPTISQPRETKSSALD
ncbi:hypothetical protein WMY93_028453 [Mugilogobius chulae]|uniref:PHD-type domain-containing protein n=1 Tax=Mugilogobius chulae TaxID=88201 RepID=A0AAW0MZE0_9GOBI